MIEKCIFCGETHETGGDDTIDGVPIKVCPMIPETVGGYFINPKEWRQVDEAYFDKKNWHIQGFGEPTDLVWTQGSGEVNYDSETGKGTVTYRRKKEEE